MRRFTALLAALVLALGLAAGAPGAAHADNSAIAINTKDGSSVFRFAFAVRHVMGDVVDETNSAVAYASCTDCHTTAIAIEIILVSGSPSVFTPTNQAIAINYLCNLCETFASAYQFVVQGSGPMHFTADGNRELKDIRNAIRRLRDQDLSPFELQAELDRLIARLQKVLAEQLVPGPPDQDEQDDGEDQSNAGETVPTHEGEQGTTTTGPAATATAPTTTETRPATTTTETTPTTTETTPATTTTGTTTSP
jgi:putative peptide zinc metalloprotease protein